MSDAQRRAFRTLLQAVTGAGIVAFLELFVFPALPSRPSFTAEQRTMAVAIAGALVALVQNLLEDHTNMPALMKAMPSAGVNPVAVEPSGADPTRASVQRVRRARPVAPDGGIPAPHQTQ